MNPLAAVVADRRALHAWPELGFAEYRTAARVVDQLTAAGFTLAVGQDAMVAQARYGVPDGGDDQWLAAVEEWGGEHPVAAMAGGMTAVVGRLRGVRPGPVRALRVDLDALPVAESDDREHLPAAAGFASRVRGVMHACGHDGHVAVALEVVRRLADRDFAGTFVVVFQPAEEGLRGGRAVAEAGVVDDVDDLVCLHLGLGLATGSVRAGTHGSLGSTKLRAHFVGRAAHAALAPERGRSALLAAASAALTVSTFGGHGRATTRVNVGALNAPGSSNVVSAQATMDLEARADEAEALGELVARIERALESAAAAFGVTVRTEVTGAAPPVRCDRDLMADLVGCAAGVAGVRDAALSWLDVGSDDAAWLIDRVAARGGRGTYLVVGADLAGGHHEAGFDFDEAALSLAADVLESWVRAG